MCWRQQCEDGDVGVKPEADGGDHVQGRINFCFSKWVRELNQVVFKLKI